MIDDTLRFVLPLLLPIMVLSFGWIGIGLVGCSRHLCRIADSLEKCGQCGSDVIS